MRRRPDESGGGGQRTGRDADVQQFLDEAFLVLRGAVDPDGHCCINRTGILTWSTRSPQSPRSRPSCPVYDVAHLRAPACVEDLDFRRPRGLDRTQILSLAQARWVSEHRDLLVSGATGCGKTYLACALAHAAIRRGHNALYWRAPRLLDELRLAHADGRAATLITTWAYLDVLVLDDLCLLIDRREQERHSIVNQVRPPTGPLCP